MTEDVPSPLDLRRLDDAKEWERTANLKRPWRADFFAAFASEISASPAPTRRVLELGSGPGFLAEHLLAALPWISYVALDFSSAMHQLARARLGSVSGRVQFVERSFRDANWADELGQFDCVVTHQAIHELRHKRHAVGLHAQVRQALNPNGLYLACDHFAGEAGMKDEQLYMSAEEQRLALLDAGFPMVVRILLKGGLVLHKVVR